MCVEREREREMNCFDHKYDTDDDDDEWNVWPIVNCVLIVLLLLYAGVVSSRGDRFYSSHTDTQTHTDTRMHIPRENERVRGVAKRTAKKQQKKKMN